jgi:hypothetical protein
MLNLAPFPLHAARNSQKYPLVAQADGDEFVSRRWYVCAGAKLCAFVGDERSFVDVAKQAAEALVSGGERTPRAWPSKTGGPLAH